MSTTAIFSTGQTVDDLMQLARLRNSFDTGNAYPDGWIPPALSNPEYVPPTRLRATNLYTGVVFVAVNTLLVSWKIFTTQKTRTSKRKLLFLEDWLLLLALSGAIVYVGLVWLSTQYQIGFHVYDLKYKNLLGLYRTVSVSYLILIWIFCTSRASLLVSIRRIYSPLKTRITILIDILIVGKIFVFIIHSLVMVFSFPEHPDAAFNLETALEHDVNILEVDFRLIAAQVSIDTIVLLSPVPLLWKLKMLPDRRKYQIMALCAMGMSTMAAAYTRLGFMIYLRERIWQDFSWNLPTIGVINNTETFLALVTACVPTANLFFKWAYNKPRIPAACPIRRARTMRKNRKRRDLNGTVDTVETTTTVDTYSHYDAEWSKGDTMHSEWSRTDSMRPLRGSQTLPDDLSKPAEVYKSLPAVRETKVRPSEHFEQISLTPSPELVGANSHSELSNSARKSAVSLREVDEEEEDNFYGMLVPSDGFFPWGTGLRPRPAARPQSETHEMRNV